MAREMKVVITLKENRGAIGISSPDCDPLFFTFEGGLEQALERLPGLVAEAELRWGCNPRHPRCQHDLASPAPAQAPARQTAPRQQARQQSLPI